MDGVLKARRTNRLIARAHRDREYQTTKELIGIESMNIDSSNLTDAQVRSLLNIGLSNRSPTLCDILSDLTDSERVEAIATTLEDLSVPIGDLAKGPADLQRITGLPEPEIQRLNEQTLLAAISEPNTSKTALLAFAEYSRILNRNLRQTNRSERRRFEA